MPCPGMLLSGEALERSGRSLVRARVRARARAGAVVDCGPSVFIARSVVLLVWTVPTSIAQERCRC